MERNNEEAAKALQAAEQKFKGNDVRGATKMALKAKTLNPSLDGLTAYQVHMAAATKKGKAGGTDWQRAVLGVEASTDHDAIKKQFKRMCLLTHPDKNPSAAADGAFKLVMEAWNTLSIHAHRPSAPSFSPPTPVTERCSLCHKTYSLVENCWDFFQDMLCPACFRAFHNKQIYK